jgi:integrase
MPARRDKSGRWRYREVIMLPNGERTRISGTAPRHSNTKAACLQAFREHVERLRNPAQVRDQAPTFAEWFTGRFWTEWVLGEQNKPSVQVEKDSAFRVHLQPFFGRMRLDQIDTSAIQRFKAGLATRTGRTGQPLSLKTRNNVLAVLSKALRYAEEVKVIDEAPRIRLYKVERPEIVYWEFAEYARLVAAARAEGMQWHVAVLLAGEAGLRLGEVLALRWESIDLVARCLTVCRQLRHGAEGTPKGRTRRTVPMTEPLMRALTALPHIRRGRVVCNPDGMPVTEGETKHVIYRICRAARLPERSWHVLRHTLATHAAQLGVNPWTLQRWLGHKRIDETMRYVHLAEEHHRPIPDRVIEAAGALTDPDQRILAMLAARQGAATDEYAGLRM